MKFTVIDSEANGLLKVADKIHVLSYQVIEHGKTIFSGSITDYGEMKAFLLGQECLVAHNVIQYDKPLFEKILGIIFPETMFWIDTLGTSWYLCPIKGFVHGLAAWGIKFGIEKPEVDDWEGLSQEEYIYRCEEDVKINVQLFKNMMDYLMEIYGNFAEVFRVLQYITFKMECLAEQQAHGITLDIRVAEENKMNLAFELEERIEVLSKIMPQIQDKKRPKNPYKQDGTLSVHGEKWKKLTEEKGIPFESEFTTKPGNPVSPKQLKEWLLVLGWKPETFKLSKATRKMLPQVSLPHGQGLCPSVLALEDENPEIKELKGLFAVRHRHGVFQTFLEEVDDEGLIYSRAQGFTNTFRLQHTKPIANLPGVDKFYGKEIRSCLKVKDDSYEMCGSDVSGLEDRTKMHYMYDYDPDYVNQMLTPGFDGHLNIAVFAGMMTKEGEEFYKHYTMLMEEQGDDFIWANDELKAQYKALGKIRKKAKPVNFGGQYGIGAEKLAEQLKIPLEEAQALHTAYWKLNWSVKQMAKDATVKTVKGQKWIYNPVSKFWMFLKEEKDRFSTLNQSTGVFVFDNWVREIRLRLNPRGIYIGLQYHDEVLIQYKKELRDVVRDDIKEAMAQANRNLQLNVPVGISLDFGQNYAQCH